jgi:RNA polymerase sigma-70 factor (ECF subfamily)
MTAPPTDGFVPAAFERYGERLAEYAARILGDRERAADVVQETFLRLCNEDRAEIEPKLVQWLYTVCRSRALDIKRKEKRMILLQQNHVNERPGAEPQPHAALEKRESAGEMLRWLERLPENQGEVLRLRFQHELSYRQIAEVTGLSVSNVGFLIHTGLKGLRERLTGRAPMPSMS